MTNQRTALAAAAIGVGTLLAMTGQAHAEADLMPLGALAAPPAGYVEMCERVPGQCIVNANPTQSQMDAVRRWAGQARWAIIFAKGPLSPAMAGAERNQGNTAATDAGPGVGPGIEISPPHRERPVERPPVERPVVFVPAPEALAQRTSLVSMPGAMTSRPMPGALAGRSWSLTQGSRPAPVQRRNEAGVPSETPYEASAETSPFAPAAVVESDWTPPRFVEAIGPERLNQINRAINRAIRPSSDMAAFGKAEYWTIPQGMGALGDCEDYVLAKRQALLAAGVPMEAMSIAVVRTRRRDLHTVLLVATPEGEVVLDNLSPWIVSWRDAPYHWLQRQAPGSELTWVYSAAA